jgi:hypothetical protein
MRSLLLALMALVCMAPAVEASTRDQRTTAVPSSAAPQSQRSTQTAATPARTTQTSTTQTSSQARTQQAAAQPARNTASNLRPGDVRTSSGGVLVRGTSAATVSREAPATRAPQATVRNAVANCSQRNGRTSCAPARSSVAGWQSGLPRADYAQRECPEGTFAALARGHEDVVRCMPF